MARLNPGDVVPGVSISAGAEAPGVFEVIGPLQRCLKDGRESFLYNHTPHGSHGFSGAMSCPSDNNQSWPQTIPYNGGWITHTSYVSIISPDNCPTTAPPSDGDYVHDLDPWVERVTCFDLNGDIVWEREFTGADFGSPEGAGSPNTLTGQTYYEDIYFVTGNQSSRALVCILRDEYLGAIGPGGSSVWNSRYRWVDFSPTGVISSIADAFTIEWIDDGTFNEAFKPVWATNKTYLSGTGYIVANDLRNNGGVLCLTSDLEFVAEIGAEVLDAAPVGATIGGRKCFPSNLDDDRVNIRMYYTPSASTDLVFEVWAIDFDGSTAPSIGLADTFTVAEDVGGDWMPVQDGWIEVTSWNVGDGPKPTEYWHRFGDGSIFQTSGVVRPNPENVETVYLTFDGGNGEAFTNTGVGVFTSVVTDWFPSTGIDHSGDSPYNGDRWGETPTGFRFSFVDWASGEAGTLDVALQPPQEPEKTFTGPPSYLGYGDYDMDDAPVLITNPHTNRAFIWHRLYWAVQDRFTAPGEDHGQGFFDSYFIVQIGGAEPPEAPAWVNFFDTSGVPDPDCPMLGSGENKAFLYDRGGARMIAEITETSLIRWRRRRDDISNATVRVSSPSPECCYTLSNIAVGRHEIVIFRNGERSWEGPITRLAYMDGEIEIEAADVVHYLSRTVMHHAYDNRYSKKKSKVAPVTQRAQLILATELQRKESLSPPINVLRFLDVRTHPKTTRTSRFTHAYSATVWEELDHMAAKLSLDYTAVGRRILINDVHDVIGRTEMLTDKDFNNPLIITVYGMELATRSAVTDGEGRWAAVGGIDSFYGEVELLNTNYGEEVQAENPEKPTAEELKALMAEMASQAQRNLAGRYPVPTVVRIPDNTQLHPTAPVEMSQLIAGMRVPIRATQACIALEQEQKIDLVTVEQTAAGETVSITLSPAPGTTPWDDSSETAADDKEGEG